VEEEDICKITTPFRHLTSTLSGGFTLVTKRERELKKQIDKKNRELAKAKKVIEAYESVKNIEAAEIIKQDASGAKGLNKYNPAIMKYRPEDYSEEPLEFSVAKINVPITIIFTADWHFGNVNFATKAWGQFKEDIRQLMADNRGRVWLMGWGDYFDRSKAGERYANRSPDFKEATRKRWAAEIEELVTMLYEELKFTKGNWLGWLEGNHYDLDEYNITTTQKLCDKLGGLYLGKGTWLGVSVSNHEQVNTFSITGDLKCAQRIGLK
jgi:hypothetical protein